MLLEVLGTYSVIILFSLVFFLSVQSGAISLGSIFMCYAFCVLSSLPSKGYIIFACPAKFTSQHACSLYQELDDLEF